MDRANDKAAHDEARGFAVGIVAKAEREFRARLLGAYLLGSLAHGGFNRRYSDVDVAFVIDGVSDTGWLDAIKSAARAEDPAWASKLSVFWTDRAFSAGRFPPLDRVDYLDHRIAIVERERCVPLRPSLTDIRSYLSGAPLESWARSALEFAGRERLEPADRKSYLRALLYPARFILSWQTGQMASNDDAVTYLNTAGLAGIDVALIERALTCRHAASDPDALFEDRHALPRHVDACRTLVMAPWET